MINPGSPTFGYLTRYEIEALAKGRLPLGPAGDVVARAARVQIGIPRVPPGPAALEALRQALLAEPGPERAWYFLMQHDDAQPELCVAIRLALNVTGDAQRRTIRSIIDRAAAESDEVKALTFMAAQDDLQADLDAGAGREFFRRA